MAVAKKLIVAPSAATRELWRVAESGDVDELSDLLARADINARNEHGMTALMRASYHGHVKLVRALLDHGADPNVVRNDNFTALSLAAFFGYTDIVEMLIGYGARTDVATRYDTSAHMWAKARSFGDVAQRLQKRSREEVVFRKPEPEVSLVKVEPEPVEEEVESAPSAVRRTLKDPPEIWDLVHEAPRNFSAGSAFVARVGSITAGVVLGLSAFLVVAGGIAGVWYLKEKRSQPATPPSPPPSITHASPSQLVPKKTAPASDAADAPATSVSEPLVSEPIVSEQIVAAPVVRRSAARRSVTRPQATQNETEVQSSAAASPAPVPPKVDARSAKDVPKKPVAPLSPQLISTPKPQQSKAKVIQWP